MGFCWGYQIRFFVLKKCEGMSFGLPPIRAELGILEFVDAHPQGPWKTRKGGSQPEKNGRVVSAKNRQAF